ncbi:MAG: flavodoxin [Oscillibacter sp.]|nr:flavodoxin [Oscillibacter sp.]MBQ9617326.1 flavodoxin [Oscillibacter sp.]
MSKIAVVYWSGTGNTETMANCIAEGAKDAGAEVDVITVTSEGDFTADQLGGYDAVAFGCSSQGTEQLEESAFEPMFAALEDSLSGKKVALFGSYGWGDGQWMRDWCDRCKAAKAVMFDDGLTINEAPDDGGQETCRDMGKELAKW